MWIIQLLPNVIIHLFVLVGLFGIIAGFVLGMIPFIDRYKLPIQIISILVFTFGVYLEGGLSNEEEWQLKVKEVEIKLANAEAKANQTNTEIVTKVLTKKQVIKEKGDEVITYIDREVIKYDNTCPIPDVAIKAHNAAALNKTDMILTPNSTIETQDHNAAATPMKLPKK